MSHFFDFIHERIDGIFELKILEIGSSNLSIFENSKYKNVTAIDRSVDKILSAPISTINYVAMDICYLDLNSKFDLIIDSHAIHCILDFEKREMALKNIYDSLNENGSFISEMMIKKNSSDSYFSFPERIVLSSFEIEDELIKHGFKIKYFSIIPNLYFLDDVSKKNTCDLLRFIAQK